ncbi:hypothetical protein FRC12_013588 [Ceratobasidium sp. 428]|nr:hypothetical protein FRC12_013588 [Ceratobasidium sp. 428]
MQLVHIALGKREGPTKTFLANSEVAPESLEKLEKEIDAIKEGSEGGTEPGAEEAGTTDVPAADRDSLQRSGRERRPVIKYAAPIKVPKQKKRWGSKGEMEGASVGNPQQTAQIAKSNNLMSKIYTSPSHYHDLYVSNGITYLQDRYGWAVCVPNISAEEKDLREETIKYVHELLKHDEARRTLPAMC